MTPPSEARQFRRLAVAYQVKVVAEDRIIAFPIAINLSMGGILVGGREQLPVGTHCGVAILLADTQLGRRVVARGTVVRTDHQGMAIAFTKALDAESEDSLRKLIKSLSPGAEAALAPSAESKTELAPQPMPSPVTQANLEGVEAGMKDPQSSLANLMDRIKPGSARHVAMGSDWEPPAFADYEGIREWLKESVMSATCYERYPDGRWTIQLLLKEQNPGTYRYIVL